MYKTYFQSTNNFNREDRTMKRTIIILSIVCTLSVAGILYGNYGQSDERESVSLEEAYAAQFPEQMPEIVLNPLVGHPGF